jgi:hypothetical protein
MAVDILCQLWVKYGTDHVRISDSSFFPPLFTPKL